MENQKVKTNRKPKSEFPALDNLKPWREDEPLPAAVVVTNKRGEPQLKEAGEERYFFRGNLLIKTWKGLSKKTQLVKNFRPATKPLDAKIMRYLKEKRGIQEQWASEKAA